MKKRPASSKKIDLPRKDANYQELADFFDRHDGVDLLKAGIIEIDPDRSDIDQMVLRYWKEPNTKGDGSDEG